MGVACLEFCGENFRGWRKNREIRESFLPRKFPAIRYFEGLSNYAKNQYKEKLQAVCLGIQDDPYKPENGSRRKTSTLAA